MNQPVEEMNDMQLGWELACARLGLTRTPPEWREALEDEWDRRGLTEDEVARQIEELPPL
jgi:hypothetical protein